MPRAFVPPEHTTHFCFWEFQAQIKLEAQISRANAKALRGKADNPAELPARVIIRADRDTKFADLFELINTCQANGYARFDLKAMTGE